MTAQLGARTFLFSDIRGSTRLWQEHAEEMAAALSNHDAITTQAIEGSAGRIFKHTGDGAGAVFSTPSDAIAAARQLVTALADAEWPTPEPLRVRIGIHSGVADERDGDFFGTAVSRTARIMDAAHADQILVSAAAAALASESLPAEIALVDLGEHRFKDLGERERVFQVTVEGMTTEFPPIRSLESFPNNLPAQLTSFVGRDKELEQLLEMLDESRLVTLTGVGGVGKTRLALQGAAESIDRFPDGVWLVELAPVSDSSLLAREIAGALGIPEEAARPLLDVMVDHLQGKRLLIVLDNCEHVIDEAAKLSEHLLRSVDGLQMIATSREGLAVGGEHLWRVPSMAKGDDSTDAVALFAERARLVVPDFAVDDHSRPAIAQICERLDGIPLAIELATARLKVFSPDQIAEHLGDRFRLLTGGSRTALPRQRTLQATMDWSYDLLSDHEKTLLRRLAVFYGGFEFQAAEIVCADEEIASFEILDLLTRLVESSLVMVETNDAGTRYRLLETVRQYALDRLAESGAADEARRRHSAYFAEMASEIEEALLGPNYLTWVTRLEADHDNIRAALTWTIETGDQETAVALASRSGRFWFFRGFIREGADWVDRVLRMGDREPSFESSNLESWGAAFALHTGDWTTARRLGDQSVATAEASGDVEAAARAKVVIGNVELATGDLDKAIGLYEETIAWAKESGSSYISVPLANVGMAAAWKGDIDRAQNAIDELMERAAKNEEMMGWAKCVSGFVAARFATAEEVRSAFEESLVYVRDTEQRVLEAWSLMGLGEAERRLGNFETAKAHVEAGYTIGIEIGVASTQWMAGISLAELARDQGDLEEAAKHIHELLDFSDRNQDLRSGALAADTAARVNADVGNLRFAASLLATADRILEERNVTRPAYVQEDLAVVRAAISEAGISPDRDDLSLEEIRAMIYAAP